MSWAIFNVVEQLANFSCQQELKLAKAIADNDLVTAKRLLQQGVDPNLSIVGQAPEPLIFLVLEKQYFTLPPGHLGDRSRTSYRITAKKKCLELLLKYGADPNARDSQGRTILDLAILWCMPDVVKLLLIRGADPNLRDKCGMTPLMKTAILGIKDARSKQDKLQIAMHLLDGGAEIDARSPDGKTALMYATGNSRVEMVELLVSSGASLSIVDRQGNRAKDIIHNGVTPQQRTYLQRILTQPQLNIVRYQYQQLIPEGDRLLDRLLTG